MRLATAIIFLLGTSPAWSQCRVVTFEEPFDGTSLDASTWTPRVGPGFAGNGEEQYYPGADNISLANGTMTISGLEQAQGGFDYTSGFISSEGKKYFRYGRISLPEMSSSQEATGFGILTARSRPIRVRIMGSIE